MAGRNPRALAPLEPAHERWTELCTWCPTLCLFTCPVSNAQGRDTVAPWGKMSLTRWLARGVERLDDESAAVAYACLGCLACRTPCRHEVEVPTVLFAARARQVTAGVAPFPAAAFQPDPAALRAALAAATPPARWLDGAQALFLPGPDTLLDAPEIVTDAFALADTLGIDWLATGTAAALDDGYGLWSAGFVDEARAAAQTLAAALRPYRKVVVWSPHTLWMLRVVCPQLGVRVAPIVEYLGDLLLGLLPGRVPRRPLEGRVRYHDPCYLGRHLGVYATPRRLLVALLPDGVEPGELRWHHESSYCCGAGGGVDVTLPETAAHAARTVTDNARELGTDLLVTGCARCQRMLRGAPDAPVVRDVVSLLADALVR
jgi:Fe-S oxidoreductase